MQVRKLSFETKKYSMKEIPEEWAVASYSNDMNAVINCIACGVEVSYGKSYKSRQYHTKAGVGYSVCEDCYSQEWVEVNVQMDRRFADITERRVDEILQVVSEETKGRNWSISQLAKHMDVNSGSLSRVFAKKRRLPLEYIARFEEALDLTFDFSLRREE
ncbi:MAG: helix-turn-helix domain-containing protein [Coriobacteriia bacterium]|nr:helix-turn-helix domain-containing protein [Coriobacteriia bacterium]